MSHQSLASAILTAMLSITMLFCTEEASLSSTLHRPKQLHQYAVVDVQSTTVENPAGAIKRGSFTEPQSTIKCDLLIVGGGTGGIAAALQATQPRSSGNGLSDIKVCLTEETGWLGGQMTTQGVSALDENYLVELSGACRNYQTFRKNIREHYRRHHVLTPEAAAQEFLNPGNCWVSRLAFEPATALEIINEMLQPAVNAGTLSIYHRLKPIYAHFKDGTIVSTTGSARNTTSMPSEQFLKGIGMVDLDTGEICEFQSKLFLDATELGDLLALSRLNYSTGSDSHLLTGEPHAPETGNSDNVQDFVFPFVVEYRQGEIGTIRKPTGYDRFKAQSKFSFQGYKMFERSLGNGQDGTKIELLPFWQYRRLIDKHNFSDSDYPFDVAMINWDSNDLRGMNIIDKPPEVQAEYLAQAKALSLGFLFWLQTEAPRDEGGIGYPELVLRKDVLGSRDGLSKFPYIREARRVRARKTIVEQDIVTATTSGARAKPYPDTVGIGLYPVDIHGLQEVPGTGQPTRPFQIPLGALIPDQGGNLLPACKNIGTTHITNGAYRLHPIEWAIGEAQGLLSRYALSKRLQPADLLDNHRLLRELQIQLLSHGIPLYWYDDVPTGHPQFQAIQFLAVTAIMPGADDNLHFLPDEPITRAQAAQVFAHVLSPSLHQGNTIEDVSDSDTCAPAIQTCVTDKILVLDSAGRFRPQDNLTRGEMQSACRHLGTHAPLPDSSLPADTAITRAELADCMYAIASGLH